MGSLANMLYPSRNSHYVARNLHGLEPSIFLTAQTNGPREWQTGPGPALVRSTSLANRTGPKTPWLEIYRWRSIERGERRKQGVRDRDMSSVLSLSSPSHSSAYTSRKASAFSLFTSPSRVRVSRPSNSSSEEFHRFYNPGAQSGSGVHLISWFIAKYVFFYNLLKFSYDFLTYLGACVIFLGSCEEKIVTFVSSCTDD